MILYTEVIQAFLQKNQIHNNDIHLRITFLSTHLFLLYKPHFNCFVGFLFIRSNVINISNVCMFVPIKSLCIQLLMLSFGRTTVQEIPKKSLYVYHEQNVYVGIGKVTVYRSCPPIYSLGRFIQHYNSLLVLLVGLMVFGNSLWFKCI